MGEGSTSAERVQLFVEERMDAVMSRTFLGGQACVFTTRSPAKETPNEDAVAIIQTTDTAGVLVVADGVGGSRLGGKASASTVRTLQSALHDCATTDSLRTAILDGIEAANRVVLDLGVGAATTLAVAEIQGRSVRPYHIGDSVILVLGQRGKLKLQTVAHSPVAFAQVAGVLDEHEALHHADRHIVSNVVGASDMRIEIGAAQSLASRDTVLIGSDGLFDNIRIDEIAQSMRRGALERCVATLAGLALARMAMPREGDPSKPDDLTIVAWRPPLRSQ